MFAVAWTKAAMGDVTIHLRDGNKGGGIAVSSKHYQVQGEIPLGEVTLHPKRELVIDGWVRVDTLEADGVKDGALTFTPALPQGMTTRRPLAMSLTKVRLKRVSADTIELTAVEGSLLANPLVFAVRPLGEPFQVGQRIALKGLEIELLDPIAHALRARFARPLDDGSYLFIQLTTEGVHPIALPAIGQEIVVDLPPLSPAAA